MPKGKGRLRAKGEKPPKGCRPKIKEEYSGAMIETKDGETTTGKRTGDATSAIHAKGEKKMEGKKERF